jgi:N-hydroxyarylamine O-acetyltransferase
VHLKEYLDRIAYSGPVGPTLECLTGIHRCQAFTIPYENLDIQLGRYLDRDWSRIYEKLVSQRRGGWCYETHELLFWALREIGFEATMVMAGVHRREFGDMKLGNHTAILVQLDQLYLADLGLGDGIRDPIPLLAGDHRQGRLLFRLEKIDSEYWRFHNHAFAYPYDFDFRIAPVDLALIDKRAHELQTDHGSVLAQNLVCQIMHAESITCLTGRVLREKSPEGTTKALVSEQDFERILAEVFGIRDEAITSVWPKVEARHRLLFADQPIHHINLTGF